MNIVKFNDWAINHILDENRFDENGFIIMENETNFKSTGIISKIFEDHWYSYYSKYKSSIDSLRPNANKEVHKIINCSNHNLGSFVFVVLTMMKLSFVLILAKVDFVLLVASKLKISKRKIS